MCINQPANWGRCGHWYPYIKPCGLSRVGLCKGTTIPLQAEERPSEWCPSCAKDPMKQAKVHEAERQQRLIDEDYRASERREREREDSRRKKGESSKGEGSSRGEGSKNKD